MKNFLHKRVQCCAIGTCKVTFLFVHGVLRLLETFLVLSLGRFPVLQLYLLGRSAAIIFLGFFLGGGTLFTTVPPSHSLIFVSDPSRAFELTRRPSRVQDLPFALLLKLPRIKDTVRCASLATKVPGHCQRQLTQTMTAFVENALVPKAGEPRPPCLKATEMFLFLMSSLLWDGFRCSKLACQVDGTFDIQQLCTVCLDIQPQTALLTWTRSS